MFIFYETMCNSSDDEPTAKRKRGEKHEEKYKRNVVRNARVKGTSYISHKGKAISQKVKPNNINCKCHLK